MAETETGVEAESAAVAETEAGVEAETAAAGRGRGSGAAGVIAAETVTAFVAAPTAASRGGMCGSPWYHALGLFACGNRRRLE